jgi:hypothetical protein
MGPWEKTKEGDLVPSRLLDPVNQGVCLIIDVDYDILTN